VAAHDLSMPLEGPTRKISKKEADITELMILIENPDSLFLGRRRRGKILLWFKNS
jgi:hypothetical protein